MMKLRQFFFFVQIFTLSTCVISMLQKPVSTEFHYFRDYLSRKWREFLFSLWLFVVFRMSYAYVLNRLLLALFLNAKNSRWIKPDLINLISVKNGWKWKIVTLQCAESNLQKWRTHFELSFNGIFHIKI